MKTDPNPINLPPQLSDADRAALVKFFGILSRSHVAGTQYRELNELRGFAMTEQQQAANALANAETNARLRQRQPGVKLEDDVRLQRAKRALEIAELQVATIAPDIAAAQATANSLFSTRDALRKHLTAAGILPSESLV